MAELQHQMRDVSVHRMTHPTISSGYPRMLKFYYNAAPNPMKIALLLEELGLPY